MKLLFSWGVQQLEASLQLGSTAIRGFSSVGEYSIRGFSSVGEYNNVNHVSSDPEENLEYLPSS